MKAAICYERNQPVRIEDVTLDAPHRDEVRVRIVATGVCHSDLSFVQGILPGESAPRVIEIRAQGSTTAFEDLRKSTCDVGMASRKIKPAEASQLTSFGDMT